MRIRVYKRAYRWWVDIYIAGKAIDFIPCDTFPEAMSICDKLRQPGRWLA